MSNLAATIAMMIAALAAARREAFIKSLQRLSAQTPASAVNLTRNYLKIKMQIEPSFRRLLTSVRMLITAGMTSVRYLESRSHFGIGSKLPKISETNLAALLKNGSVIKMGNQRAYFDQQRYEQIKIQAAQSAKIALRVLLPILGATMVFAAIAFYLTTR
jgi:hypothetical protein